jgi:hypothetical protein
LVGVGRKVRTSIIMFLICPWIAEMN